MNEKNSVAVLWDMDGVIADTGDFHMRSWQAAFRERGITVTEADFQHVFGMKSDSILEYFLGRPAAPSEYKEIVTEKEIIFRKNYKDHVKSFPGAVDLIKSLHESQIRQALVSSTPIENINLILGTLGVKDCFRAIISGGDVTEGKPSPQGYLLGAPRLEVSPSNCVVIEDAVVGVAAAKAGGMKCIAITNTNPADSLKAADLVVDSLEKVNVQDIVDLAYSRPAGI